MKGRGWGMCVWFDIAHYKGVAGRGDGAEMIEISREPAMGGDQGGER